MSLTCKHPDNDEPRLMCGHSLPCPYHTALLHMSKKPPTVEIPVTAAEALQRRLTLAELTQILAEDEQ